MLNRSNIDPNNNVTGNEYLEDIDIKMTNKMYLYVVLKHFFKQFMKSLFLIQIHSYIHYRLVTLGSVWMCQFTFSALQNPNSTLTKQLRFYYWQSSKTKTRNSCDILFCRIVIKFGRPCCILILCLACYSCSLL